MTITYRTAVTEDVAACMDVRGKTRENPVSVERLRALGITYESWTAGIMDGSLLGYVCLDEQKIVGYCFGYTATGEVAVLALLPDWEGRGIGKHLLDRIVRDFVKRGFQRLFLGCSSDPSVRSFGFYRHLGWKSTGTFDAAQDEVLEYFPGN